MYAGVNFPRENMYRKRPDRLARTSALVSFLYEGLYVNSRFTKIAMSVSYTHLDVYKRQDLLLPRDVMNRTWVLRKYLSDMNPVEAMEFLQKQMSLTDTNEEFLATMNH